MAKAASEEFQRDLTGFVRGLAPEYARRIRGTTRLFESGVMDSLKVLDLISYLETALGIRIPDERVTLDNFRSIRAMTHAFWKPEESSH
ncbi:MAG: acyl carrier protein [Acidobacteriia bacterium]|nr:acyl carrier protein [Terriglobia bacterium]